MKLDECTKEVLRDYPTYELQILVRESSIERRNGTATEGELRLLERAEEVLNERTKKSS